MVIDVPRKPVELKVHVAYFDWGKFLLGEILTTAFPSTMSVDADLFGM
jgi:hypothetical protein